MEHNGQPADEVLARLDERLAGEPDPHDGRLFGLVYPSGDDDLEELIEAVYHRYLFGNALNPFRFPSLAEIERDVVDGVGRPRPPAGRRRRVMTSGGTESILMSMLVSRERARARGIERPTDRGARTRPTPPTPRRPTTSAWRSCPSRSRRSAGRRGRGRRRWWTGAPRWSWPRPSAIPTGSSTRCPSWPRLAAARGVGCHVDACIGGFVLPFLEAAGSDVPPWDFRVPGVTEISADIHKYGYTPKGASVVLHRDGDWRDRSGSSSTPGPRASTARPPWPAPGRPPRSPPRGRSCATSASTAT